MKSCPKCWKTYRLEVKKCPHCTTDLLSLTETTSVLAKRSLSDTKKVSFDLSEIEHMPREETPDSFFPQVMSHALGHTFRVLLIVGCLLVGILLFIWAVNVLV